MKFFFSSIYLGIFIRQIGLVKINYKWNEILSWLFVIEFYRYIRVYKIDLCIQSFGIEWIEFGRKELAHALFGKHWIAFRKQWIQGYERTIMSVDSMFSECDSMFSEQSVGRFFQYRIRFTQSRMTVSYIVYIDIIINRLCIKLSCSTKCLFKQIKLT